jgi:hypothetical protein
MLPFSQVPSFSWGHVRFQVPIGSTSWSKHWEYLLALVRKELLFKKLMINVFLQAYIKKHVEKLPNVLFGGHFMSMNTPTRKRGGS